MRFIVIAFLFLGSPLFGQEDSLDLIYSQFNKDVFGKTFSYKSNQDSLVIVFRIEEKNKFVNITAFVEGRAFSIVSRIFTGFYKYQVFSMELLDLAKGQEGIAKFWLVKMENGEFYFVRNSTPMFPDDPELHLKKAIKL